MLFVAQRYMECLIVETINIIRIHICYNSIVRCRA